MAEFKLKVLEAIQDDVNKGIVRIDSSTMRQIGISPGDNVSITGERETICITGRGYPGDIGLNIIRMDGITRRNAKTGIGERVNVKKATVEIAKKVVIAPAKKGFKVRASELALRQQLYGRALMKGDIVTMGGSGTRRRVVSNSPKFEDIFSAMDASFRGIGFGDIQFKIIEVQPKSKAVIVTETTTIELNPEAVEIKEDEFIEVTYEDIGGLDDEIKKIREMVELPLKHPELFQRLGIEPPKGVLLYGPPGTGKTLLAKAIANETQSNFVVINGPEIMSKYYGQSEENLRKKFEEAEKNAPSIIFIDEIDAIAPKREESKGEVERRVVAQLLAIMDGLKSRGKVVVIAATNMQNDLDPALRRPGRFDREIDIGVPKKEGRLEILKIHTRNMPINPTIDLLITKDEIKKELNGLGIELKGLRNEEALEKKLKEERINKEKSLPQDNKEEVYTSNILQEQIKDKELLFNNLKSIAEKISKLSNNDFKKVMNDKAQNIITTDDKNAIFGILKQRMLDNISQLTHGFAGADLAALAKETAMIVLRRIMPDLRLQDSESIPKETLEKLQVREDDFMEALKFVRPSSLREVLIEKPNVSWEDVGGLEKVRQELLEAVEWPLKNPKAFTRLGIKPPRGVLLYGAPGTGKTLLAKAVAKESDANFIYVKGPELISKWVGESEKGIRKVFEKARTASPTIIFFDEIDSIAYRRGAGGSSNSGVNDRVVNQLLTEMDGLIELQDVVIIAATNRLDRLDTAILRPGRFDRIILCPIPTAKARMEILKIHTAKMPLKDVDLNVLAEKTEGYVGADIEALCREAAILALRKDIKAKEITMENFTNAIELVGPSVTTEIEKQFETQKKEFKKSRAKELAEEKPSYLG